jgi:16S rRNA C1402 (ribose-2'-O) methylase RsmI
MSTSGTLFVVATPLGNLEDITLRVLSVLREADVVACEDTRRTRVLLDRYGVDAKLVSAVSLVANGNVVTAIGKIAHDLVTRRVIV